MVVWGIIHGNMDMGESLDHCFLFVMSVYLYSHGRAADHDDGRDDHGSRHPAPDGHHCLRGEPCLRFLCDVPVGSRTLVV